MRITTFPKQYKLINEHVQELRLYYEFSLESEAHEDGRRPNHTPSGTNAEGGAYDFFITLRDGRCFGFSAYTPEFLRDYMEHDHDISFVDSGIVIVRRVTKDAIMDALEKCFYLAKDYGIEHFGYTCSGEGERAVRPSLQL
jgi:hypothetical protein